MYGRPNPFSFFLFPIWPLADLGHQTKLPQSHISYSKWQPGYSLQSEWTHNSMRLLFSATVSRWRADVVVSTVVGRFTATYQHFSWQWNDSRIDHALITLLNMSHCEQQFQQMAKGKLCSLLATHNKNLVAPLNTIQLIWGVNLNMCKLPCLCPVGKTHHFIHDAGLCSSVQSTDCFLITMSVSLFVSLHLLPLPVNCELVP